MAERVIRQRIDDLDGKPVADNLNERIEFSFRGTDYVIDLRPTNAEKMKSALRQYIDVAQIVEATMVDEEPIFLEEIFDSGHTEDELQEIIRWARIHNYTLSPYGRVTQQIIQAFNAAHR